MLRIKPYGYDVLADHRNSIWIENLKDATHGSGIDLALEHISEDMAVYNTHETPASSARFTVIRGSVGGQYDPVLLSVKPTYGAVWEGLSVEVGYNSE